MTRNIICRFLTEISMLQKRTEAECLRSTRPVPRGQSDHLLRVHESGMLHESEDAVVGARARVRMEDAREKSMETARESFPFIEISEV
jgi:hypothetical protein